MPDKELQKYFSDLPMRLKRELAMTIRDEAEGLAAAIRAEAPRDTGALVDSVQVRRKKHDLELEVTAGGATTTRSYDRRTGYEREVVIDGRSNEGIAKREGGDSVSYDYALANEYGTEDQTAQPFFYPTVRARRDGINERISEKVREVLEK